MIDFIALLCQERGAGSTAKADSYLQLVALITSTKPDMFQGQGDDNCVQ